MKVVWCLILVLCLLFLFNNWKQYLRYVNLGRTRPTRMDIRKRVQKEKTKSEMLPNIEMRQVTTLQTEIKSEKLPGTGKVNLDILQEEPLSGMLPNTAMVNREISQETSQFETLASKLSMKTTTMLLQHENMSEILPNSIVSGKILQEKMPEKSANVTTCTEAKHLYFLKNHKAGSTTIQNLFSRFAMKHRLNVLTPINRSDTYPLRTFDQYLPKPPPSGLKDGKYDVYCEHSIYNEHYLLTKLQKDSMNIAILREPMSHLLSILNYISFYNKTHLQNTNNPVETFLQNPKMYGTRRLREITQNHLALEFGYNERLDSLKEFLPYIESRFLVLIMERLPESMILHKRTLCWSMKDVFYLHAKERVYAKPTVNKTLVSLHKLWSPLDYSFYAHFDKIMTQSIADQDNNFEQEVALFNKFLERSSDFCRDISQHKKASNHHANLPLEMYSFTL